jgi:carboxypeptidase Q
VTSWSDLDEKKDQVPGKIVVFNAPWVNYGTTVDYRVNGASRACKQLFSTMSFFKTLTSKKLIAKYGAVAALIMSVTPFSLGSPHTGMQEYADDVTKIPVASIAVEDAQMMWRMQNRGQRITLNLILENHVVSGANSNNFIVEIPGNEKPNEIVLFGGHVDSWDTGSQTGANDDGGGVITCFEAIRVLYELGLTARRTLRMIGWSGEEFGAYNNGAEQYAEDHEDEVENHILAFESDEGSTKPYGFGFTGSDAARKIITQIAEQNLKTINCTKILANGGGADAEPLNKKGVPMMSNAIWEIGDDNK